MIRMNCKGGGVKCLRSKVRLLKYGREALCLCSLERLLFCTVGLRWFGSRVQISSTQSSISAPLIHLVLGVAELPREEEPGKRGSHGEVDAGGAGNEGKRHKARPRRQHTQCCWPMPTRWP